MVGVVEEPLTDRHPAACAFLITIELVAREEGASMITVLMVVHWCAL